MVVTQWVTFYYIYWISRDWEEKFLHGTLWSTRLSSRFSVWTPKIFHHTSLALWHRGCETKPSRITLETTRQVASTYLWVAASRLEFIDHLFIVGTRNHFGFSIPSLRASHTRWSTRGMTLCQCFMRSITVSWFEPIGKCSYWQCRACPTCRLWTGEFCWCNASFIGWTWLNKVDGTRTTWSRAMSPGKVDKDQS